MPRRREVAKRVILPDPKFNDRLLAKFMNVVMLDGKKSTAEQIVYGAFDLIQQRSSEEPLEVFGHPFDGGVIEEIGTVRRSGWSWLPADVTARPARTSRRRRLFGCETRSG